VTRDAVGIMHVEGSYACRVVLNADGGWPAAHEDVVPLNAG
jgi:hypothetical protein